APYAGMKVADVQALAQKAGVLVNLTNEMSGTVGPGKIISQAQKPGTNLPKGATLDITASIGEPLFAFDNGSDIFVADGYAGGHVRKLEATDDLEAEPSWNRKGTMLVFRRGPKDGSTSRIYVADDIAKPDKVRALTNDGFVDRRPAISPNNLVVAFVRAK